MKISFQSLDSEGVRDRDTAPLFLSRLLPWLRIVRIPNLLTVPGDPLAGAFLARMSTGGGIAWTNAAGAGAAAVLIYAAGLISNDVADRHEDSHARPFRPIPSGQIPWRGACRAGWLLTLGGIAISRAGGIHAFYAAVLLAGLSALYNFRLKRYRIWGPLNMGLCRGVSLLMGAAAAGWLPGTVDAVAIGAAGITLYITVVTVIARDETEEPAKPVVVRLAWLPMLVAMIGFAFLAAERSPSYEAVAWICATLFWIGFVAASLWRTPVPGQIPRAIGGWIRGMLLIQATLMSWSGNLGFWIAAAVVLAWVFNARLSRSFHAS